MRRSIQLPQLANLTTLPPADRSRSGLIGLGVSEVIFNGPAANLRPCELILAKTERLAGGKTIGSGRLTAQALS